MKKILIIDDVQSIREMLKEYLMDKGYQVETAENGLVGLDLISKFKPQVLLLDLIMPVKDGYQLLEDLAPKAGEPYTIIVMTGHGDHKDAAYCYRLGASYFLCKPVDFLELDGLLVKSFRDLTYAQELKRANEELKALDQLKDDFLANTTHELRTPMVSILGYVETLLECDVGKELQVKFLRFILEEGEQLSNLIENILDISAINAGKLDLFIETVPLNEIIAKVHRIADGMLLEKTHINIIYPQSDILLECDKNRIIQVLVNILANAIKFSPENGVIEMVLEKGIKKFTLFIKDQGPGIPEDYLTKIFDKFQRVQTTGKKQKKGTGLGLSVSKGIIEAHQGKIWAENNDNGAVVAINLKLLKSTSNLASLPRNGENQASNILDVNTA